MELTTTKIDELWGGIGETVKEHNDVTVSRDNHNTVRLTATDGSYETFNASENSDGTYCVLVQSYDQSGQWNGAEDDDGEYETEHEALVAAHKMALAGFDGMAY